MVDVEAVGGVGGHAAGRGVRLHQVAQLLEVGHRVADGGRRETLDVAARDRPRADRLPGLDVLRDDCEQHLPVPLIERRAGHGVRRSYR
jgi:hypothetical protein